MVQKQKIMLFIFTNQPQVAAIQQIIDAEFRLNEVVSVKDMAEIDGDFEIKHLIIKENAIWLPIDWANEAPPYLLDYPLHFTKNNLLAVVYTKLNNYEQAYPQAEASATLLKDIDTLNCIQHGVAISMPETPEKFETDFDEYRFWHNAAAIAHYAELTHFVHYSVNRRYYERAFDLAPNDEFKAFTGKHWATLLLDAEELGTAEQLLTECIAFAISDNAKFELMNLQYGVWMKQLTAPYDPVLLEKIKQTLWEVLQYYERTQNQVQIALLLIDASQIANYSDSFSESLGYISRAVQLLEQENVPELVANAQYRKATLLYTWAQNGNPQFFRPAMDAYQQAVKVFTKENTPEVFAEIQHHLGVIYSEIPDEIKVKSVWAAISVSSFKEALNYFTRETHPYEYARICNSYANALTKYPEAKLTDNYAKALDFYRQALEIRTADEYPYERVLSILNFLEAAWQVSVPEPERQQQLFEEMNTYAHQVLHLVDDPKLQTEAHLHLQRLMELRAVMT
jgi:tetratricopeptide (TPR) repeat protein